MSCWDEIFEDELTASQQVSEEMESADRCRSESDCESDIVVEPEALAAGMWWLDLLREALEAHGHPWPSALADTPRLHVASACTGCSAESAALTATCL